MARNQSENPVLPKSILVHAHTYAYGDCVDEAVVLLRLDDGFRRWLTNAKASFIKFKESTPEASRVHLIRYDPVFEQETVSTWLETRGGPELVDEWGDAELMSFPEKIDTDEWDGVRTDSMTLNLGARGVFWTFWDMGSLLFESNSIDWEMLGIS